MLFETFNHITCDYGVLFFFSRAVGNVNIGELNVKLGTVAYPVEKYLVHIRINRVFQLTWLNIYHILNTPNYTTLHTT